MNVSICHPQSRSSNLQPKKAICASVNAPTGMKSGSMREENYSEQATLRASALAFRKDNDSTESTHLSVRSILPTLQGNKDKLVRLFLHPRVSHPASTLILSS